ncbi:hypothetical protein AB0F17_56410 [Nonomuraea sp. NPDC026600]|uniref:hypothetical protein n=1 Tax=Nonomuraea sp. NPDC026600 TaxID=3155363 RepID=UPI0033C936EB
MLAILYLSHCVRTWLRGRHRPSTAGAHTASTTPAMVRALPPGCTLTVRAADGAVIQIDRGLSREHAS